MTTRGISLNNPCNLMHVPSIKWDGEIVPTADPKGRLCQFDTVINGLRAAAITLLSYYLQDGCDTVQKIITRYAPPVENPTGDYAIFVAKHMSVGVSDTLIVTNESTLSQLLASISQFEQGKCCVTVPQIAQAIQLAFSHDKIS